jgi:hypothetical protein
VTDISYELALRTICAFCLNLGLSKLFSSLSKQSIVFQACPIAPVELTADCKQESNSQQKEDAKNIRCRMRYNPAGNDTRQEDDDDIRTLKTEMSAQAYRPSSDNSCGGEAAQIRWPICNILPE